MFRYATPTPLTGVCPVCSQRVKVKQDGTLWSHQRKGSTCKGSGMAPRPGSVKRKWPYKARGSVRTVSGGAMESNRRRH
jgi:hypothetical protein